MKTDGMYLIERSTDNKNNVLIGMKVALGTPLDVELFYCLTDKKPISGNSYYRLSWIENGNSHIFSSNKLNPNEQNIPDISAK